MLSTKNFIEYVNRTPDFFIKKNIQYVQRLTYSLSRIMAYERDDTLTLKPCID